MGRKFRLTRIIHECLCEAFQAEVRRGFSHVRQTEAYWQSVEEAERAVSYTHLTLPTNREV